MEEATAPKGLNMDALVEQLSGFAEFTNLKDKVSQIETSKTKVSAALPKVQREKLERKVAYEDSKESASLWNGIVFKNRQEEYLRFDEATPDRQKLTSTSLVSKFEPTTDMEKEIEILEKSGMKEGNIQNSENRDLETIKLSVQEVRERNQELSRMKSLMFYQEQKNKRINKIKSKKFRRIHKKAEERRQEKERELLKEVDPALYHEITEQDAMKRARERMSLKHKNTSKWVKRALTHGGMADADTREAINAQLQEGEKLRRRMEGDDGTVSEEDADRETLLEEAQAVLDDIDGDSGQPHSGVFQMEFMKRALQRQKDEARADAEKLMQSLRDDRLDTEPSEEEKKEEVEQDGESEQATAIRESLKGGVARREARGKKVLQITENIRLQEPLFAAPQGSDLFEDVPDTGSHLLEALQSEGEEEEDHMLLREEEDVPVAEEKTADVAVTTTNQNPWLATTVDSVSRDKSRQRTADSSDISAPSIDVKSALQALETQTERPKRPRRQPKCVIIDEKSVARKKEEAQQARGPVTGDIGFDDMSQRALMSRAFADAGAEAEFDELKQREADRDTADYKKEHGIKDDVRLEGWGSWAGIVCDGGVFDVKGAPEPKRPRLKETPAVDILPRSDAHLKHVIINQKKDKKSTEFMVEGVPFPFTSREQYERAMRQPIGREWNTQNAFHSLTRPEVKTRIGTIIDPISDEKKRKPKRRL